jgi:3-oxoacyl-[acyl-carrier-protein] synthase-1
LGAAGAIEAAIAAALLLDGSGFMPVHPWDGVPDPALPGLDLIAPGRRAPGALKRVLSSNFGFGGSNAALILERV